MLLVLLLSPWSHASARIGSIAEWDLPSGLVVLQQTDARFPWVRVAVSVHAGMATAPRGKRTVAHLAEHLAFRAEVAGEPVDLALMAAGCRFNAYTALDTTTYQVECPKDAASVAIRFALALSNHDLRGLDAEEVKVEAQVVLNETTQRQDDGGLTVDVLARQLFTGDHPYALGDEGSSAVLGIGLDDVHAFYAEHYVPSRTVIAVHGDIDRLELAELITQNAGDDVAAPGQKAGDVALWPGSQVQWMALGGGMVPWFRDPSHPEQPLGPGHPNGAIHRTSPPEPVPDRRARTVSVSGGWPGVVATWYLPAVDQSNWWQYVGGERFANADLERVLGADPWVVSSGCHVAPGEQGSMLSCGVQVEDADELELTGRRVLSAFEGPLSYPRQAALVAAEGSMEDWDWFDTLDADRGGIARLSRLADYRVLCGLFDIAGTRQRWLGGGLGFRTWQETYARWLTAAQGVLTYVQSDGREPSPAQRQVGMTARAVAESWGPPALGPVGGGDARTYELPNGLKVVGLDVPGLPIVTWRIAVPAGEAGSEDLARFLATAIRTPQRVDGNFLYYDPRVTSMGATTVIWSNQRGAWDPRQLLRAFWGTVQGLRTEDLSLAFHRKVAATINEGRSAYSWRGRIWRQALREHPEQDGLPEISALMGQKGAIDAYLRAQFQPERATLVVAGDLREDTFSRIEEEMGDWVATDDADLPEGLTVRRITPRSELVLLDRPRAGRTVSAAWMCPTIRDPGSVPNAVAGPLLGELAFSRLWEAARVSSGLTYTPYAWDRVRWGGLDLEFVVETELGLEREALAVIREVATSLGTRPATTEELAAARRRVYSDEIGDASSLLGAADELARSIGAAGSLRGVAEDREAMSSVDARALAARAGTCGTTGVAVLIGDAQAMGAGLEGIDLPVRTFDWMGAHLDMTKEWLPSKLGRERGWVERYKERLVSTDE